MSKVLDKKYRKLIESYGAKPINPNYGFWRGYTHVIETKAGNLYLKVDTTIHLLSIFGNFLEDKDLESAKELVGHWKYNLHWSRKDESSFPDVVEMYFDKVLKK